MRALVDNWKVLIVMFIMNFVSIKNNMAQINGFVKPGFEPVYEAFNKNFAAGKELGAALCVFHKGEKVVDLWGGIANKNTNSNWDEKTLDPSFTLK